jgi:hypothetical protein
MNQLEAPRWSVNKDMDSNEVTDVIRIPGKEWQETQFYNIDNCRNVSVPGYFDVCMEHRSFLVDIFTYLSCIIYAYSSPHRTSTVSGYCTICGEGIICAKL